MGKRSSTHSSAHTLSDAFTREVANERDMRLRPDRVAYGQVSYLRAAAAACAIQAILASTSATTSAGFGALQKDVEAAGGRCFIVADESLPASLSDVCGLAATLRHPISDDELLAALEAPSSDDADDAPVPIPGVRRSLSNWPSACDQPAVASPSTATIANAASDELLLLEAMYALDGKFRSIDNRRFQLCVDGDAGNGNWTEGTYVLLDATLPTQYPAEPPTLRVVRGRHHGVALPTAKRQACVEHCLAHLPQGDEPVMMIVVELIREWMANLP